MGRPGRGQNRGRRRREGGAGGEAERNEQSGCPESLHPQSDPPFPPLLSPAHPHPSPSMLWPSLQISSTPALLLTVPRTFPSPDPGLCLLQRHPPHPHPRHHPHPGPIPAQLPVSLLPLPPPPRSPYLAYLQLSDGHDLLPSQFHLPWLRNGQLCHPVPALLWRTRGHPTGPGPAPRSREPRQSQQPVSKEKQGLGPLLPWVSSFVLH